MRKRASRQALRDRMAAAECNRRRSVGAAIELLEPRCLLSARPLITEFMADNESTLFNEFLHDHPDWIEIYNPGPESVDLEGWYLTDRKDELHRWQFPASLVLKENEYVVVFASGLPPGAVVPEGEWHASFQLGRGGEYLGLVRPDGTTIVAEYEPEYPPQQPDVSYGLTAGFDEETFFATPTPGAMNPPAFKASVFSPESGFYAAPILVSLDTAVLAKPIHYTFDGSVPTAADAQYETAIPVTTTTTLRVRSLAPQAGGTVYTQTYLFLQDVAAQPAHPEGWPQQWQDAAGSAVVSDYEFDPEVATNPAYVGSLTEDLLALPSVALTIDPADLFGPETGIYANPLESGRAWERPCSLEFIYPDGRAGLQVDAGVRIRGGDSREPQNTPKHSFRLTFRSEYGPSTLEADVLTDADVDEFDALELVAGFEDSWLHPDSDLRQRALLMRDQWIRATYRDMGQPSATGQFVHLYLNGLYWGVYNLTERIDDAFGSIHFEGRKEDYDFIDTGTLEEGTMDGWQAMLALLDSGLQTAEAYQQIQRYVDLTNFIDLTILRIFAGDRLFADGDWLALRNRSNGEPFRFFPADCEHTLVDANEDTIAGLAGGDELTRLFLALRANDQFRRAFADRVQYHFFQEGALTPARNAARWQSLAAPLADAMVAESGRWGDYRRDVHPFETGPFDLYSRNDDWQVESSRLLAEYFPVRSNTVLTQFRDAGLYPEIEPPVLSSPGGTFSPGFALALASEQGIILYTLNGPDPALADGSVHPDAVPFVNPIALDGDTLVRSRTLENGQWSALVEASFFEPMPLEITEIHYHAAVDPDGAGEYGSDAFDFLELMNVGLTPIDLTGVSIADAVRFAFAEGAVPVLGPGQRVVVVENLAAFTSRYNVSSAAIAGEYAGRLNNASEPIRVTGSLGQLIAEVTYDDDWYPITDTEGFSLVRQDEVSSVPDLSAPQHWRPSRFTGGSPAMPDGGLNPDAVVISEALTHNDGGLGDWVELHNTTHRDIDISGWYLSDTPGDLKLYQIPTGTILPANGYLLFSHEIDPNYVGPYGGRFDFTIDKLGEKVYLTSAGRDDDLGGYRAVVDFTYGFQTTTFIRHTNSMGQTEYVPALQRTPGQPNSAPAVERIRDHGTQYLEAVISEIMYHPTAAGDEYIELYNPHAEFVRLDQPFQPGWRFTSGVFYNFPDGTTIPPKTYVLIVPIDPETFRAKHNVPEKTRIFGPYDGELLNTGERLVLTRAAEPAAFVPFSMMDQVFYNRAAGAWPAEADGMGASLNRLGYRAYGNDVANWTAGALGGTPGRPNINLDGRARIVDRMVFYNGSTFDGNDQGANVADDAAIAVDKWPLRPGEAARFMNYTSYPLGINGIMLDIQNLPMPLSSADFEFRVGNHNSPAGWGPAPTPLSITARMGAGSNGSDRVTVLWPAGAITNQWLRVKVLATEHTGLETADVHYWGNAVGDTGNSVLDAIVDPRDQAGVRSNAHENAAVVAAHDIDRNGVTNAGDEAAIQTVMDAVRDPLVLIDLRSGKDAMPGDMDLNGTLNLADIGPFIIGLSQPQRYLGLFGVQADLAGDSDGDGDLDFDDIAEFITLLRGERAASLRGDMNANGILDGDDIARFTVSLAGSSAYQAVYGAPVPTAGDADRDGDIDFDDIDDFRALIEQQAWQAPKSMSARAGPSADHKVERLCPPHPRTVSAAPTFGRRSGIKSWSIGSDRFLGGRES